MVSSCRLSIDVNFQIAVWQKTFLSDLRFKSINLLGDKTKGILEKFRVTFTAICTTAVTKFTLYLKIKIKTQK